MACPALESRAGKTTNLEADIGAAEDGSVEVGRVCGTSARTERSVGIQGLGTTEDVAQDDIEESRALGRASLSSGLDGVARAFGSVNEDGKIGRSGRSIRLVGLVDVGRDGSLEDTEAVEFVDGAANLAQSFLESVGTFLVVGEDRVEDALEEAPTRVLGLQNLDGRDGDRLGRVEADQLGLALLCFGILLSQAVVQLLLSLGVGLVLEQCEELRVGMLVLCAYVR